MRLILIALFLYKELFYVEQLTQDVLLKLFFIAIVVDFVTGILASAKEGRLKSRTCSNGMFRSLGECVVLLILMTVSYYIPSIEFLCKTFTLGFVFKEALSITENLARLGVWIPTYLKDMLEDGVTKVSKDRRRY